MRKWNINIKQFSLETINLFYSALVADIGSIYGIIYLQ